MYKISQKGQKVLKSDIIMAIEFVHQAPLKVKVEVSKKFKQDLVGRSDVLYEIIDECNDMAHFFNQLPLRELCMGAGYVCVKCFTLNTVRKKCRGCRRSAKAVDEFAQTTLIPCHQFYQFVIKNITPEFRFKRRYGKV